MSNQTSSAAAEGKVCTDPIVGAILSGWRYDISSISPEMRTDYEQHLVECPHCRHRQRVARTIDVLLISVSSLSILAFLLAAVVLHRVEVLTHIGTIHVHLRQTFVAISLEAVAIAGLAISIALWVLVAVATPLPGFLSGVVQQRIPADLRQRLARRPAALKLPMAPETQTEMLPPLPEGSYAAPESGDTRVRYSEWDPRSAPGTYLLLAINVAVYLWMVVHGVSWTLPTPNELVHYGANSAALVLDNGEWYRLLAATFVHIGILHIATNMWCLWNLGLLGEPLIGPYGLVAVYVLTGVAGNLLAMAWDVSQAHWQHVPLEYVSGVGAGASGAVFGIAGILIVLLSNRRLPIPWSELKRLRTSVVRFAAINLLIGGVTIFAGPIRIDNSAHIGGFLSGLALGPGLVPRMTAGRLRYLARQRVVFFAAAFALSLFGYWIANLK